MRYLPIHVDLQGANVLIIGGGKAAEAKLRTLVTTEANLSVLAPEITPEIQRWVDAGKCVWEIHTFTVSDLDNKRLVYAASENADLDAHVLMQSRAMGILVNTADNKDASDFFSPAIVDRAPVTISIGTEGTSPALARAIKADIEARYSANLGGLALALSKARKRLATIMPDFTSRQRFWAKLFGQKDALQWNADTLRTQIDAALEGEKTETGHVALVGAGPGNPDLLTHQARHRLFSADVIVYDRLVSKQVLEFGRKEAEYIYVGKVPNGKSTSQNEINAILVEKVLAGLSVVRLKGGDPLVFGRVDEEIDALAAHNIPYEICPGITAAQASAAAIGVSLTARGHNKAVSLLTGHDTKGFAEQDWAALARPDARAAIYMGVGAARFIQGRLLVHGADANLPVTIVENASRSEQIIVSSTLESLADDLVAGGIKGPAILMIGYAVREVKTALELRTGT